MNKKQKWTIIAGLGVIVTMLMIPPWKGTRSVEKSGLLGLIGMSEERTVALGYSPIFDPPSNSNAEIDGSRLVVQLIVVAIASGVAFFLLKGNKT